MMKANQSSIHNQRSSKKNITTVNPKKKNNKPDSPPKTEVKIIEKQNQPSQSITVQINLASPQKKQSENQLSERISYLDQQFPIQQHSRSDFISKQNYSVRKKKVDAMQVLERWQDQNWSQQTGIDNYLAVKNANFRKYKYNIYILHKAALKIQHWYFNYKAKQQKINKSPYRDHQKVKLEIPLTMAEKQKESYKKAVAEQTGGFSTARAMDYISKASYHKKSDSLVQYKSPSTHNTKSQMITNQSNHKTDRNSNTNTSQHIPDQTVEAFQKVLEQRSSRHLLRFQNKVKGAKSIEKMNSLGQSYEEKSFYKYNQQTTIPDISGISFDSKTSRASKMNQYKLMPSKDIKEVLTEEKAIEIFENYNREREFMSKGRSYSNNGSPEMKQSFNQHHFGGGNSPFTEQSPIGSIQEQKSQVNGKSEVKESKITVQWETPTPTQNENIHKQNNNQYGNVKKFQSPKMNSQKMGVSSNSIQSQPKQLDSKAQSETKLIQLQQTKIVAQSPNFSNQLNSNITPRDSLKPKSTVPQTKKQTINSQQKIQNSQNNQTVSSYIQYKLNNSDSSKLIEAKEQIKAAEQQIKQNNISNISGLNSSHQTFNDSFSYDNQRQQQQQRSLQSSKYFNKSNYLNSNQPQKQFNQSKSVSLFKNSAFNRSSVDFSKEQINLTKQSPVQIKNQQDESRNIVANSSSMKKYDSIEGPRLNPPKPTILDKPSELQNQQKQNRQQIFQNTSPLIKQSQKQELINRDSSQKQQLNNKTPLKHQLNQSQDQQITNINHDQLSRTRSERQSLVEGYFQQKKRQDMKQIKTNQSSNNQIDQNVQQFKVLKLKHPKQLNETNASQQSQSTLNLNTSNIEEINISKHRFNPNLNKTKATLPKNHSTTQLQLIPTQQIQKEQSLNSGRLSIQKSKILPSIDYKNNNLNKTKDSELSSSIKKPLNTLNQDNQVTSIMHKRANSQNTHQFSNNLKSQHIKNTNLQQNIKNQQQQYEELSPQKKLLQNDHKILEPQLSEFDTSQISFKTSNTNRQTQIYDIYRLRNVKSTDRLLTTDYQQYQSRVSRDLNTSGGHFYSSSLLMSTESILRKRSNKIFKDKQ